MSDSITVTPVSQASTAPASKSESIDVSPVQSASERLAAKQEASPAQEVEVQETSAPEAPKEEKRDPLASKFAALTKRQRELVQKEQQLKELEAKYKPFEETITNAKANPLKLLEQAGLTTEEFLQFIINDGEATHQEDNSVEAKLAALEKKIAEKDEIEFKAVKEQEAAKVQKQINDFKEHINNTISENSDKYELVSSAGQQDVVYDVILQHFNETATIMPVEQALELVENYLLEEANKLLKTQKLAAKVPQQPQANTPVPQAKAHKGITTLSNSAAAPVPNAPAKALSPEQKKEQMAALLRFK